MMNYHLSLSRKPTKSPSRLLSTIFGYCLYQSPLENKSVGITVKSKL